MAFCKNCGTDIGDANLCPACGATQVEEIAATPVVENEAPAAPVFAPDPLAYSSGMNTVSEPVSAPATDNTFGGSSTIPGSMGSTIPGSGDSSIPAYAAPVYSSPVVEKPKATGQIVFASINIGLGLLLCCCSQFSTLLGMAVGIAALILAIISRSASTSEDAASKLKIALILNIISIVLIVGAFILVLALGLSSNAFQSAFESALRS